MRARRTDERPTSSGLAMGSAVVGIGPSSVGGCGYVVRQFARPRQLLPSIAAVSCRRQCRRSKSSLAREQAFQDAVVVAPIERGERGAELESIARAALVEGGLDLVDFTGIERNDFRNLDQTPPRSPRRNGHRRSTASMPRMAAMSSPVLPSRCSASVWLTVADSRLSSSGSLEAPDDVEEAPRRSARSYGRQGRRCRATRARSSAAWPRIPAACGRGR